MLRGWVLVGYLSRPRHHIYLKSWLNEYAPSHRINQDERKESIQLRTGLSSGLLKPDASQYEAQGCFAMSHKRDSQTLK